VNFAGRSYRHGMVTILAALGFCARRLGLHLRHLSRRLLRVHGEFVNYAAIGIWNRPRRACTASGYGASACCCPQPQMIHHGRPASPAQADCAERDAKSMFGAIQARALSLRVEVIPINMRDASEIKPHVETFPRKVAGR